VRHAGVAANSGENWPETVETLTPTFSNTCPFITPRTPPPGSGLPSSSRCHSMYSNAASEPASRSIASNSAQMRVRRLSNQSRASCV
jgi:hypothetical protein